LPDQAQVNLLNSGTEWVALPNSDCDHKGPFYRDICSSWSQVGLSGSECLFQTARL